MGKVMSRCTGTLCAVGLLALLLPSPNSVPVGTPIGRSRPAAQDTPRPAPGPIERGFAGIAYPVPARPAPGMDLNVVPVTLRNEDGQVVGTDVVRAGQPRMVEALDGGSDDLVAIAWSDGVTALARRENFWAMPSFVELKHMTVTIDRRISSLADSGLVYHRGSPGMFDDPQTPGHDGISPRSRQFLACTEDSWSIGQQTFTVDLIELGVHRRDRSLIDMGVVGVDWGAAVPINDAGVHELYRDCDGTTVPDFGGTHHTTQWLESMGRAVYLLAASEYAGDLRTKIDSYIDRIEVIAGRLVRPDSWQEWVSNIKDENGHDFTHRTFMMAAALGLASTLTDSTGNAAMWADTAARIVKRGIGNQEKNGVNPERGGYDVLYQMYGVWLGEIYHSTLSQNSDVKVELETSIDRAIDWMTGRVDGQTGQIVIGDSTRICAETNWWSGRRAESHDVAETVRAFLLWAHVRADTRLVDQAALVDRGQKQFGNECPAREAAPSGSATEARSANTSAGDRSFETPIGTLSNRRVLAAAAAALICFVLLSLLPLEKGWTISKLAVRVGSALVVFAAAVVALAA